MQHVLQCHHCELRFRTESELEQHRMVDHPLAEEEMSGLEQRMPIRDEGSSGTRLDNAYEREAPSRDGLDKLPSPFRRLVNRMMGGGRSKDTTERIQ